MDFRFAPRRSRATFVELLCACLVSPEGWVTRAIGSISRRCHWTTYYKLIERGSVRSAPLAPALLAWVQSVLPQQTLNLVIDDTLALRHSPAPGSAVRHDHKTNRPDFVQAQCWVTLGVSVLSHGNAKLVLPLLSRGIHVIAQARIDTALFLPPDVAGKPAQGRPRKYGQRLTAEASAVWCEFYDETKQAWSKPRLLLATETELSAQAIVELYARRWGDRTLIPQSETLVGHCQSLATVALRLGNLDANRLHRLDAGTIVGASGR